MPLRNPRGTVRFFLLTAICVAMPSALRGQADSMPQHHHAAMAANSAENKPSVVSGLSIPDINLVDQHGRRVRFYSDLVKGKVVAINTIFTTCTTICPLMGANYSKLGKLLTDADRARMNLISISIDPSVDTPARLDQWSKAFGPVASNWTLLTGAKSDVDSLLKALQVFTADKQDHAPVVLVGGDGAEWARASALQSPASLADLIHVRLAPPVIASQQEDPLSAAAHQYFTDVQLVTQNGDSVRLYTDLLKAKVVIINAFFGTCTDSCPKMSAVLEGLQNRLGDHLGKDVFILSFSVDPDTDTPAKLKEYAERFHARPGWLFLTGSKDKVDLALFKLGQKVSRKEDHLTMFIVGNNRTGLWKKVFAPSSTADSLKTIVDSVLHDKG